MKIIKDTYLFLYQENIPDILQNFKVENLSENINNFEYLFQCSSVFSANIEGNSLDLNSFMNAKEFSHSSSKEVKEIDNLLGAYTFARGNNLNEKNFLKTHFLLSETLLIDSKRGKYREEPVGVFGKEGLIYMAIEQEYVQEKMHELFSDIKELIQNDLKVEEVLYYTSMIHLVFVHIHPFSDGNGRAARLLEKWFLQEKLGENIWSIPSEEYYWNNRSDYYKNINLGVNYYELNYDNSLNFLLMLTNSLEK